MEQMTRFFYKNLQPVAEKPNAMFIPALLAYIGVFISGVTTLDDPAKRSLAIGLLIAFGFLFFGGGFLRLPDWAYHVRLALQTILVAALVTMQPGWGVFPVLFFILGPEATIHFPNRIGVLWIGIFSLITAVIFVGYAGLDGLISLTVYIPGNIFFAIFGKTTVEAMRARRRSDRLLAELQQAHEQLQAYADRLEELTITEERNRIAREMHDTLGHRLTVASVQLEGAQRLIPSDPNRAVQILGTVREQIRDGLGELRRTVALLRAPVDEDLPLRQALTRLTAQVSEATGLRINLDLGDCPENLPPAHRQALYRAGQEALTNIQRHAEASDVWLQLTHPNGWIVLLVSDNGRGLPAETGGRSGFGLTGLKERAALLNGDFHIDPRPGGGTQLTFRLPFDENKEILP